MEGYLNLRIRPWLRRLMTRLLAIIPAIIAIAYYGETATGFLLVLSQVILSLQLPFAIIPLIHFVSDRERMGEFVIPRWVNGLAWLVAVIIIILNLALIAGQIGDWLAAIGSSTWIIYTFVIPLTIALGLLLLYVTLRPWLHRHGLAPIKAIKRVTVHGLEKEAHEAIASLPPYQRVAIACDFSERQERLLAEALRVGDEARVQILLALTMGDAAADKEVRSDQRQLERLTNILRQKEVQAEWQLGAGDAVTELARMINAFEADLVILGAHGHSGLSDLVHGTTVERLRHRVQARILVVPL